MLRLVTLVSTDGISSQLASVASYS
jgi:hypothetical protein